MSILTDNRAVRALKDRAQNWARRVVRLSNMRFATDQGRLEQQRLLKRAKFIKNSIENVVGVVPELDPLNQLGAIPVVVGAVGVGAAAALIYKWETDADKLEAKHKFVSDLISNGYTPQEAEASANAVLTKKPGVLTSLAFMLAIGAGLYMLSKRGNN